MQDRPRAIPPRRSGDKIYPMTSSSTPVRPLRVGIPFRTRREELTDDGREIQKYLGAVRATGGDAIPVSLGLSLPELRELAKTLDAIVLSGSPADLDPSHFGAKRHKETAEADPERERADFALLEHAFSEKKPVLAICYGIQSLNVYLGGSLVQDIPSEVTRRIRHDWDIEKGESEPYHPAHIDKESRLASVAGAAEVTVNSSHHQSILEPGRNLKIVARAPDGVVEAVEWTGDSTWVMGVQWHPERMVETDPFAQALFRKLLASAGKPSL